VIKHWSSPWFHQEVVALMGLIRLIYLFSGYVALVMAVMDLVSYYVWKNLYYSLYKAYHDTAWPSIIHYIHACV
jgi:hypothetical protein